MTSHYHRHDTPEHAETPAPSAAPPSPLPCTAPEIYLIDASSFALLDVNDAALANLQATWEQLAGRSLPDLAAGMAPGQAHAALAALVATLGVDAGACVSLRAEHQRRDGSLYALQLRLLRAARAGRAVLVALGEPHTDAREHGKAPGLVYQFVLHADANVAFPSLSESCQALLGLDAASLQRDPSQFLHLVLPEDRRAYLDAMHTSAQALSVWNWEGRIWIDAWKDVKWINLRATPRALAQPAGSVLWEGIMNNITEGKLEQVEVRQSRARLAELTAHIEQVKEQERTRIAREIHDDLGGNLTAIKMALAMLSRHLPAQPAVLSERAAYLDSLVDRTIDAVHRISLDLRPPMLDLGLVAALEWQVREFEKQAGLHCSFYANDKDIALSLDHATALFRIFQEALTNIAKHARASHVSVRLQRLRHHISLKITDNGAGIAPGDRQKPHSFGLRGMNERARALGGTMSLHGAPGGGTVVTIKIKRDNPEPADNNEASERGRGEPAPPPTPTRND
ncbi:MAG: ATP-binding protein [Pseudomonadota bacterium]